MTVAPRTLSNSSSRMRSYLKPVHAEVFTYYAVCADCLLSCAAYLTGSIEEGPASSRRARNFGIEPK